MTIFPIKQKRQILPEVQELIHALIVRREGHIVRNIVKV